MTNKVYILLIFVLLLFKLIAVYFTNFTLYGDEAQYWLWSKSLDLGYFSKPPLLAWFLSGYAVFFGDSFFSLKIFPLAVYVFVSFAIYKLSLKLSLSKGNSVLCSLSFLIIPATSLSSFLISTDLLLLLFWTMAMTKLLETRSNSSDLNFFLLGLLLGLAFLSKYAAVYFFIALFFLIIADNKTLNIFKKNWRGSVLFIFAFIVVILPNIYWNLNNGWVTLQHTAENADLDNLNLNFYEPIKFLLSQILMIGPILCFSFFVLIKYFDFDFENIFLLAFSLPIIFIVLIESFLVRANANWAATALISFFILFFRLVSFRTPKLILVNFLFNYVVAFFLFGFIFISSELKMFDRIRGVDIFAKEVSSIINNSDLVISDRIIFSNMSYYFFNKQNKIFMPYNQYAPVTNHFQTTSPLNKKQSNSFYLIGNLGDTSYLLKKHEGVLIKEFDVPFNSNKLKLYEVNFK